MRTKWSVRCITALAALFACAFFSKPAAAQSGVDQVSYFCDGTSGVNCLVFELDGSRTVPNADACVGTEDGCNNEEDAKWPDDWDSLLFPALAKSGAGGVPVISGTPPGAYSFGLPWNQFGSFSGVIKSTLVTTGTSTILKQGSKATDDIPQWVVATQASPPKDAYLAGTIATYIAPPGTSAAGDQLVYLGSTRNAPNGSAVQGVWFFQENIAVCASGPNAGKAFCVAGTTIPAVHKNKDLFLFISYGGNGSASIIASEWQNGSLVPAASVNPCPANNDIGCAISNNSTTIKFGNGAGGAAGPGVGFNVSGPGWPGFAGGVVPVNQFQEQGVDFNAIFGGIAPCFSSVMFASVSSGSAPNTASLKSILLGSFNTCAISATKNCGAGTVSGSNVIYPITGTVENIGGGQTTNLTLVDKFNDTVIAFDNGVACTCSVAGCNVTGTDCSTVSLNPGSTVNYAATITTSNNGGNDVILASMGGAGGGSASATSNTAICSPIVFNSGVSISKQCDPGATLIAKDGEVVVQVKVDGSITNNDDGNLPLSNVNVYNCIGASFSAPTGDGNADKATCAANGGTLRGPFPIGTVNTGTPAPWSDTYLPSVAPSCGPYNFGDQALVTADCTSKFCKFSSVDNVSLAVNCPLCPGPNCAAPAP